MTDGPTNHDAMIDWKRVWAEVEARRVVLGWSKKRLYDETGVSEGSYRKMRDSGVGLKRPDKVRRMTDSLQWHPEALDYIMQGIGGSHLVMATEAEFEEFVREQREYAAANPGEYYDWISSLLEEIQKQTARLDAVERRLSRLADLEETVAAMGKRLLELAEETTLPDDDEGLNLGETGAGESGG